MCRTNRLYPNKFFGRIVDYFGVFDDAAKALQFDEESIKQVISNMSELRDKLPQSRQEKTPVAALTELFLELKTEQTPAVVERIVADIDAIVRVVRFPGWQTTSSGERGVQQSLRKALLKYQLHKDQVLFDRAYGYIKEYY